MVKFTGIAQGNNESLLYFLQQKDGIESFSATKSSDGFEFSNDSEPVVLSDSNKREVKKFDFRSFRISKQENDYFLTFKEQSGNNLYAAISKDLKNFTKIGELNIKETGVAIPDFKLEDHFVMYFGEKGIKVAYSSDYKKWKSNNNIIIGPRIDKFDNGDIQVGNTYQVDGKILLVYYVKKYDDVSTNTKFPKFGIFNKFIFYAKNKKASENVKYLVGAALFDKSDPTKPIWRTDEPIWEHSSEVYHEKMQPLGSVIVNNELLLYWLAGDNNLFVVSAVIPNRPTDLLNKEFSTIFKKADNNPIISPRPEFAWESRATFNSAAVYEDGKVHFVYRALGDKDLSVLGYATSTDGLNIDWRSDEPIYIPREPFETPGGITYKTFADHFASGGGYGGVEDPRITKVDDTFYMTYVAFDGANPPRVALTSISVDDFLKHNWDKWEKPKLISAPNMVNKNAVIFPEKVNGKYVIFHRIYPNVLIDYVDDLAFDNTYLQGHHFIPPRKTHWDSKKIGAGAPPIKTKDGWLFVYQSVGYKDPHQYKIGAMLLDLKNPSKVISRTSSPIVEPNENYENEGFKAGVAYPCGAVVMDNKLHVYYGGADTVVCAASTDLDKFLYEMKNDKQPKLTRAQSALFSN